MHNNFDEDISAFCSCKSLFYDARLLICDGCIIYVCSTNSSRVAKFTSLKLKTSKTDTFKQVEPILKYTAIFIMYTQSLHMYSSHIEHKRNDKIMSTKQC